MTLFEDLNQHGNTIVLVTHEEDIAAHARRIVRLRDGKVREDHRTTPPFSPDRSTDRSAARILTRLAQGRPSGAGSFGSRTSVSTASRAQGEILSLPPERKKIAIALLERVAGLPRRVGRSGSPGGSAKSMICR